MKARWLALASPILRGALLTLFCFFAFAGPAGAADVSPFTTVDAAACAKLDDKNLQVGPPDAEIVEACAALRRSQVFGQSFSGGPGALALALFGMVLVYAAFGVPMRSAAGLMERSGGRTTGAMSVETVLGLILRGLIGLLFLAILSLPYAMAAGCVVIVALLILQFRPSRVAPVRVAPDSATAPPSVSSVVIADLINDAAASAVGLLALALLARRDLWLLCFGIALAIVASAPAVIAARRRLRRRHAYLLAAAAILGAILGVAANADPLVAQAFAENALPGLLIPLVFAAVVLGAVQMGSRNRAADAAAG